MGGVFELGNLEWRGAQAVLEIQVDGGGGVKNCAFRRGVWIFSGITHYDFTCVFSNPLKFEIYFLGLR